MKKAAKKKAVKKTSKAIKHKLTITGGEASDKHARLRRRKTAHDPDSITWKGTDQAYTIDFTTWPFKTPADAPPRTINVPSGRQSRRFKLDENTPKGGYGYMIKPGPGDSRRPTPEVVAE